MAKKKYKGIDLFCGIGGFRLAMEDNNVMCVFSSDNDKFAQETYQANFGEIPEGDKKKLRPKTFLHLIYLRQDFHANHSAMQAKNKDLTMR